MPGALAAGRGPACAEVAPPDGSAARSMMGPGRYLYKIVATADQVFAHGPSWARSDNVAPLVPAAGGSALTGLRSATPCGTFDIQMATVWSLLNTVLMIEVS